MMKGFAWAKSLENRSPAKKQEMLAELVDVVVSLNRGTPI